MSDFGLNINSKHSLDFDTGIILLYNETQN